MDNYIPASIQTSEQLKHYKHAEAQHQYHEKSESSILNLEKTQEKVHQRMQLQVPLHFNLLLLNSHKPIAYDPEHPTWRKLRQRPLRSVMPVMLTIANRKFSSTLEYAQKPPDRKFVAKFGADAFFSYYIPQHKLPGADFLPGLACEYAQQLKQGLGEHNGVKGEVERVGKQSKEGSKKGKIPPNI
ncbi:hypothetical protein B0H14DRAFT_2604150 [Mycena olivaceomarginata]|nr:hypothetical protein B0H14DRAFT_2604150 [Mycena olivaceomarginata]